MTRRTARRAQWMALALRAFPKRWRTVNGGELLATAARLDADGLSRPIVLDLIETVLAGWDVRLSTRPPLRHRLAYRLLWRPVPAQWHRWMRDDLASRWVGLRFLLWSLTLTYGSIFASLAATDGLSDMPPWFLPWCCVISLAVLLTAPFRTRRVRRDVYRKAGWTPTGASPPPPRPDSAVR